MRVAQLVVVIGFAWASCAAASERPAISSPASATSASVPQANRELVRRQAEVKRLEQDLGKQKLDSQRASERLQQQDKAIAELHKQLQELQANPAAGQH
jgi:septal ring factor EnvC (AmiA/AmiB activator)